MTLYITGAYVNVSLKIILRDNQMRLNTSKIHLGVLDARKRILAHFYDLYLDICQKLK